MLLLDQHLHDRIWSDIAREITGRDVSEEEFKKTLHGRTNKGIFEHLFGREIDDDDAARREKDKELKYQDVARNLGSEYELAPGAVDLFEDLKRRAIPFTIGTSSPPMNVSFFNETFGLGRWFDMSKVVCGDGTVRGKPFPDIYLKAAQMLSLEPCECVVIEDAESGIAAADAAGIGYIIGIGPREERARLRAITGVSKVIASLDEVIPLGIF